MKQNQLTNLLRKRKNGFCAIGLTFILIFLFTFTPMSYNKVEKVSAEDSFSYRDIKGTIYSGQTMIIPSQSEMVSSGLIASNNYEAHARIKNTGTLTIEEGGVLIVPSNVVLQLCGTINNYGTIIVEDLGAIICTSGYFCGIYYTEYSNISYPSSINCYGGKLIIEEKGTVTVAKNVEVTDGGLIDNKGVLMVGKNINVDNAQIQCSADSQLYLGYYFYDRIPYYASSNGVAYLDSSTTFQQLNIWSYNSSSLLVYFKQKVYLPKAGSANFSNLAELAYYITREAKFNSAYDSNNPFVTTDGRYYSGLEYFSTSSVFVDEVPATFTTTNNGAVCMEKGALIFAAHRPAKTWHNSAYYWMDWTSTNLFNGTVGTDSENGEINMIVNNNGVLEQATRSNVLIAPASYLTYSFASNMDFFVYQ